VLTLNAVEYGIASWLDASLAQAFTGARPTHVGRGDALGAPMGAIGVGLEQNLSTAHFLPGSLSLFDNALQLDSFLLRPSNALPLPHGTPPCAT